ncbi:hypothetical protein K8R04_03045 [Candidatus Uhrbacteria bacterium]|nr:hypothetical protein [Candidatus Uhrbacteria bacterium]
MGQPKTVIRIPKHIAHALKKYQVWAMRASKPLEKLHLTAVALPLEIEYRETSVQISDMERIFHLHSMTLRWEGFRADVSIEVYEGTLICLHEVKTREGTKRRTFNRDELQPPPPREWMP